jgi:GNAT superfamily N-acetyltransferase
VLKVFQRQGIGTMLLDRAEAEIAMRSASVGIGVGLYADYGAAQSLYVKRGYVPDKRGISYGGTFLNYGDRAQVDDDLVLYLIKIL